MIPTLTQLLKVMLDKGASDLHITAGTPPRRINAALCTASQASSSWRSAQTIASARECESTR